MDSSNTSQSSNSSSDQEESNSRVDDWFCIHCWNPVKRIEYKENSTPLTRGTVENVWKHKPGRRNVATCSHNPLTDADVIRGPFI